jgi:ABC-type Fe3+ transport system permease subunit
MAGGSNRRWGRTGRGGRQRRLSPLAGCLVWVLAFLVVLLLLSLIFGGFQRGTKVGGGSAPGQGLQPAAQEVTLGGITGLANR